MLEESTVLYFRRASLVSNSKIGSDLVQVRILPDMVGIPKEECPWYAPFNPSELFRGPSEEDADGNTDNSLQLWVVCTEDFKTGWVFGEANLEYHIQSKKVDAPYAYKSLYSHLRRLKMGKTDGFKYPELKILNTNSKHVDMYNAIGKKNDNTKSYDIMNVRTGERWMFMDSGVSFAMQRDGITLRVGSPNMDHSFIRITNSKIEIVSNQIVIWGKNNTSLGKHGYHVVGMLGAPTAVDGSPLIPMLDMTC